MIFRPIIAAALSPLDGAYFSMRLQNFNNWFKYLLGISQMWLDCMVLSGSRYGSTWLTSGLLVGKQNFINWFRSLLGISQACLDCMLPNGVNGSTWLPGGPQLVSKEFIFASNSILIIGCTVLVQLPPSQSGDGVAQAQYPGGISVLSGRRYSGINCIIARARPSTSE